MAYQSGRQRAGSFTGATAAVVSTDVARGRPRAESFTGAAAAGTGDAIWPGGQLEERRARSPERRPPPPTRRRSGSITRMVEHVQSAIRSVQRTRNEENLPQPPPPPPSQQNQNHQALLQDEFPEIHQPFTEYYGTPSPYQHVMEAQQQNNQVRPKRAGTPRPSGRTGVHQPLYQPSAHAPGLPSEGGVYHELPGEGPAHELPVGPSVPGIPDSTGPGYGTDHGQAAPDRPAAAGAQGQSYNNRRDPLKDLEFYKTVVLIVDYIAGLSEADQCLFRHLLTEICFRISKNITRKDQIEIRFLGGDPGGILKKSKSLGYNRCRLSQRSDPERYTSLTLGLEEVANTFLDELPTRATLWVRRGLNIICITTGNVSDEDGLVFYLQTLSEDLDKKRAALGMVGISFAQIGNGTTEKSLFERLVSEQTGVQSGWEIVAATQFKNVGDIFNEAKIDKVIIGGFNQTYGRMDL